MYRTSFGSRQNAMNVLLIVEYRNFQKLCKHLDRIHIEIYIIKGNKKFIKSQVNFAQNFVQSRKYRIVIQNFKKTVFPTNQQAESGISARTTAARLLTVAEAG